MEHRSKSKMAALRQLNSLCGFIFTDVFTFSCRKYSTRNPLERRSMKELMAGISGGRGGRGGRGRKKGGMKKGRQPDILLGRGKKGVRWPGLSYPLSKIELGKWFDDDKLSMKTVDEESPEAENTLGNVFYQDLQTGKRYVQRLSEKNWSRRGWTGIRWGGRYVGCPEMADGTPLTEFKSTVIELKRVANQTKGGKKRTASALVVVGNGNGAVGFSVGKGEEIRTAVRKAKNRAVNCLQVIPRCDNHTIYHNVDTKYCRTRIIMRKSVPGTGLKCQRAIAAICELAGIKDLNAKIVGSTNPLNIVRATFKGLSTQDTHQTVANRSGKYLVELRPETGYRPVVVAVPDKLKKNISKLNKLQLIDQSL